MARQCRVTIEIEEDGKLVRSITETRGDDYDRLGELVGEVLSVVPVWVAACGGVADDVLFAMTSLSEDSIHAEWVSVADAYRKWSGIHNFDEGVKVVVNPGNICEGDHVDCPICKGNN